MSLRAKAVKGSVLLSAGEATAAAAGFVRNMILARLLGKADFGIAATFAMIIALLEFSAKMGVGRFLVRDPEGDRSDFMASAHFVQFSVGLLSALLIAACAWPLTWVFGIAGQTWAVMLLALAPLLRGCEHLDVRRFERGLRFGPSALVEVVPQVLITMAVWPLAKWLRDYRAVLVILLVKALFSCGTSRWLAERRYAWGCQRDYVVRMLRFGWPLVVNGFLMFGVLHGEHFLVASFYTMGDLASYAAASALALAPGSLVASATFPVILPLLARVQDDREAFERRYRQVVSVMGLFAAVSGVGSVVAAEALMRLVYGQKYVGSGIILASLAVTSALRNVRIATSLAALAKGDSQNEMRSNGTRLVGLLPALALAMGQQPVWLIACTGVIGETAASVVAALRLRRRDGIRLSATFRSLVWVMVLMTVAALAAWSGTHGFPTGCGLVAGGVLAMTCGGFMVFALPELRREAADLQRHLRTEGWRGVMPFLKGRGAEGTL